jgi:hypothetical protein
LLSEFYRANPECPKNKNWKEPEENHIRTAGNPRKRKGAQVEEQGTRKSKRIC